MRRCHMCGRELELGQNHDCLPGISPERIAQMSMPILPPSGVADLIAAREQRKQQTDWYNEIINRLKSLEAKVDSMMGENET